MIIFDRNSASVLMRAGRYIIRLQSLSRAVSRVRGVFDIGWSDILREARARCRGYFNVDIAELVARGLSEDGIKVWR